MTVVRPLTLEDALAALRELNATVVAGGTDIMVEAATAARTLGDVVAVRRIPDLQQIRVGGQEVRIGAAVTYSRLTGAHGLNREAAPVLSSAAAAMGSTQVRSMGTLGGNVGTASPVGDCLCALLALDARATLANAAGVRTLPVGELIHEDGGSALAPGDLLIDLHWAPADGPQRFLKVCRRAAVSRSVVSASVVTSGDGTVRIVIGGCGARPQRMTGAERLATAGAAAEIVANAVTAELSPIDDVAASAAYRRHAAGVLVRRALASSGLETRVA